MSNKTFMPGQIVGKLRRLTYLVSQGKMASQAYKEAGIVDQVFYRWRRKYGGLRIEQDKRMKDLQRREMRNFAVRWPIWR